MSIHQFPASNFDFGLENSAAVFPVTERPIKANGSLDGLLPIHSHKCIVRADKDGSNPRSIGVVGHDYKLLKNGPFFGSMEQSIRRNMDPSLMDGVRVKTNVSFDGAWVEREYVFPKFAQELKTSTAFSTNIGFRIISWNSYDGSSSAGVVSGLVDFYCKNGMLIGSLADMAKRRHTKNLTPDYFDGQIVAGIQEVQEEIRKLRKLAVTELDVERAERLLKSKFSEQRADRLIDRMHIETATRGNNVFALHSALTYYASHDSEEFGVRKTGNDNVAKTLHGRQAEIAKVLPAVYAMAA